MGSRPSRSDFQATEAERASAGVAKAGYEDFKRLYGPLLRDMRDQSLSTDPTRQLRGRANADTMQALTKNPTYQGTQALTQSGETAQALTGQLGQASAKGKAIENTLQTNVLGTARGQAADAQSGMAQASNMATSNALNKAAATQMTRNARNAAAAQVGTTLVAQGLSNMSTRGSKAPTDGQGNRLAGPPQEVRGSFFAPVNSQGQKALSIVNRANYSGTLSDPTNPFSPFAYKSGGG